MAANEQAKKTVDVDKLDEAELRTLVPTLLENIAWLSHRVEELTRTLFGKSSEKSRYDGDKTGVLPFTELEDLKEELKAAEEEVEEIEVPGHKRKVSRRRKDFPDHLPVRRTEFTIGCDDLSCPDCGVVRFPIGEETCQELERIEFTYVHIMARKKYACRKCEGNIVIAEGGQRVLEKSLLGPGFLAQIIFERFSNHMPYARLEKKYRAEGLSLSRSVMSSSVMRCAELLKPIYEAHRDQVLESLKTSVLQSDDTTILQRNGSEKGQRDVYLWAWRDQHAGVFYTVSDARNRDGPRTMLKGFEGRIQCDGHDCYSSLDTDKFTRIGCWAHVRRYFSKALKSGDANAQKIIDWIGKLFRVEREARDFKEEEGRDMTDEELVALRHEKSRPIIKALKAWLDSAQLNPPSLPSGPLMKGVGYAINQWSTLTPFLDDGRIREISNNGCERALRAPVIGRKNWNWFGSKDGAQAAVVMMSLVQSCREHGINPLLYLRDVLLLVSTTPQSKVCELTPRGWKAVGEQESRLQRAKDSIAEAVQSLEF